MALFLTYVRSLSFNFLSLSIVNIVVNSQAPYGYLGVYKIEEPAASTVLLHADLLSNLFPTHFSNFRLFSCLTCVALLL